MLTIIAMLQKNVEKSLGGMVKTSSEMIYYVTLHILFPNVASCDMDFFS